jgi:magnesium transporter
MPWLVLGLLGGILAARIVGGYEDILSKNLILAAFIPLIVYMADAVGTQMEAFIIRDLAVNPKLVFSRYLLKQIAIIAVLGSFISMLLFTISFLIYHTINVSIVLAISLFCAILSSVFSGLLIPWLFARMKFDPADASGPIATILQDTTSIVVYFSIASLLL